MHRWAGALNGLLLSVARVQALAGYVADPWTSRRDQPWMLQQLLQGSEYSSYSIAHEGRLVLHSDTEAPRLQPALPRHRQPRGPLP